MKLHENPTLFRQAVQFTAQQMGIFPIFVEKDYWVTFALKLIFQHPVGEDTVFKGGTALSKCYTMIERFSEDIDLVVLRREGETDNRLKAKLKQISAVVSQTMPEVASDITRKLGMNRKTAHVFPKVFTGNYGQARQDIIIESTWLGYPEPCTTGTVRTFIHDMMQKAGQEKLILENELQPFGVRVLEPARTICEKIMSLVRFSYGDEPIEDLKKKIRHAYDLHQLLQQPEYAAFLDSPAFSEMLLKVAAADVASFRSNNGWLNNHPSEAKVFADLASVWDEIRSTYQDDFRNLVYGMLPPEADVAATLHRIKERLLSITWTITTENKA